MTTNNFGKMMFVFIIIVVVSVFPSQATHSQTNYPQGNLTEINITADLNPALLSFDTITLSDNSNRSDGVCEVEYPSPFSIQIAGLHEFLSASNSALSIDQLEALQEQARNELDVSFPDLLDALSQLGAGWARVYIDWAQIEPIKGSYNWDWYDPRLMDIASIDVKMIATVSNPPAWASLDYENGNNSVKDPQDYYDFLEVLVGHYKDAPYYIDTWEIMNEQDAIPGYRVGDGVVTYAYMGRDYAILAEGASEVIKRIDPNATVIMGGVAYDSFVQDSSVGKFDYYLIDDMMVETYGAGLDALNFHYFHDFYEEWERWSPDAEYPLVPDMPMCTTGETYSVEGLDVVAKLTYFTNRVGVCYGVDKPIWISEVGHHGTTPENFPDDQDPANYDLGNQARYVFTVYARALAYGADNITWYALKIVRSGQTEIDYQGLLDDENNPKRAFWAYETLTRELKGYKYDRTLNWGNTVEAYVFSNPCGQEKIIAWVNPDNSGEPREAKVYVPGNRVELIFPPEMDENFDPIEQIEVISGVGGSTSFTLTSEPVIITNDLEEFPYYYEFLPLISK